MIPHFKDIIKIYFTVDTDLIIDISNILSKLCVDVKLSLATSLAVAAEIVKRQS